MKTFTEKEEKLNSALEKLKNLNFVNPKLKEHTDYLDNKKNQLEIEKQQLEEKYRILLSDYDELKQKIKEQNQSQKNREFKFIPLSMGNPHAVICVEDLANTAVKDIGEALGNHPDFPSGVNVGFMQIISEEQIKLRVFERGTGETLACGTGACAAVVAGRLLNRLNNNVKVGLPGGSLDIHWEKGSSVVMTGPTKIVYEGTIDL